MTTLLADLLGLKEFASCYHGNGNCSECPVNEIGGSCQDNGKMLIKDICDKLIPLLEQGRLVRLPCKVGDTVYYYNPIDIIDEIVPMTITDVKILGTGELELTYVNEYGERVHIYDNYFGKNVFLTREAAETALNVPDTNIGNIEEGA